MSYLKRGSTILECPVCGDTFKRSNTDIRTAIKKGYRIHCSNRCRYETHRKREKKVVEKDTTASLQASLSSLYASLQKYNWFLEAGRWH